MIKKTMLSERLRKKRKRCMLQVVLWELDDNIKRLEPTEALIRKESKFQERWRNTCHTFKRTLNSLLTSILMKFYLIWLSCYQKKELNTN